MDCTNQGSRQVRERKWGKLIQRRKNHLENLHMGLSKTQINLFENEKSSKKSAHETAQNSDNFFSNSDKFFPNSNKFGPNSDKFVRNSNKFGPNSD